MVISLSVNKLNRLYNYYTCVVLFNSRLLSDSLSVLYKLVKDVLPECLTKCRFNLNQT